MDLTNAAGCFALAFVLYKVVELGPYEATALIGRCVHIFLTAALGRL